MNTPSRALGGVCAAMIVALMIACSTPNPQNTFWQQNPQNTAPAVKKEALAGGEFNKFFPKDGDAGWSRTFDQEKHGTAVASVSKGGTKAASISVFDTVSDPSVAEQYKDSTTKLDGYPYLKEGNNGSSVLVADRFHVKVQGLGKDGPLSGAAKEDERKELLKKFDLAGLAKLNK